MMSEIDWTEQDFRNLDKAVEKAKESLKLRLPNWKATSQSRPKSP